MNRSLTREEVLEMVDGFKKVFNKNCKDTGICLVKDQKELNGLWLKITHSSDKSKNLPTIDIHNKNIKPQRKIHIDIYQNK